MIVNTDGMRVKRGNWRCPFCRFRNNRPRWTVCRDCGKPRFYRMFTGREVREERQRYHQQTKQPTEDR
jgi:hypothetical protein